MFKLMTLAPLLLLAACVDPRQACLNDASRDLRIVRDLIDDTEANLERGYAIRSETRIVQYTEFCFHHGKGKEHRHFRFCNRSQPVTSRTPVAVDLDEEQRKLDALKRKELELQGQTKAAVQSCEKTNPES